MSIEQYLSKITRVNDRVHLIAVPGVAAMIAVVLADVVGRRFFGSGVLGSYSLVGLLLVVVSFGSAAVSWREGLFIRIDLFSRRFGERSRLVLDMLAILIGLVCIGALFWLGLKAAIISYGDGSRAINWPMPLWPWKSLIPIGCILFFGEMTVVLIRVISKLMRKEKNVR